MHDVSMGGEELRFFFLSDAPLKEHFLSIYFFCLDGKCLVKFKCLVKLKFLIKPKCLIKLKCLVRLKCLEKLKRNYCAQ